MDLAYQALSVQAQMLKEFLIRSAVGGMFIIEESAMSWGLIRGGHRFGFGSESAVEVLYSRVS